MPWTEVGVEVKVEVEASSWYDDDKLPHSSTPSPELYDAHEENRMCEWVYVP